MRVENIHRLLNRLVTVDCNVHLRVTEIIKNTNKKGLIHIFPKGGLRRPPSKWISVSGRQNEEMEEK